MVDLDTGRTVSRREGDAFHALLHAATPEDWDRPTRCRDWTVRDLAAHMAGVEAAQATGLERMLRGDLEQPAIARADSFADRAAVLDALDRGGEQMAAVLERLRPGDLDALCPLPFAVLPGFVALQIVTAEHGIHRNDLAWALGDEAPLAPDVSAAHFGAMGAALPMLAVRATAQPAAGTAIRLCADSVTLGYAYEAAGWTIAGDGCDWTAEVAGDDSAVCLFMMGRIPANHPSLRRTGDVAISDRFKEFFPGP